VSAEPGFEEVSDYTARMQRRREELEAEETPDARRHRRRQEFAFLLAILGMVGINWVVFHLAGSDYLRWFVANGSLIALGFALVSVAVDLNRHTGLIATSAAGFVATLLEVFSELAQSIVSLLSEPRSDLELWDEGKLLLTSRYHSRFWDVPFGLLFVVLCLALMAGWMFVVAPLQYLLNLPCGAPARLGLASGQSISAEILEGGQWRTVGTKDQIAEAIDRGATEISFSSKPVTLTSALSALVLYGASQFV
jgi:hypothetical protein